MKRFGCLCSLLLPLIFIGCSRQQYLFEPVGTYSNDPASERAIDDQSRLNAEILCRKTYRQKGDSADSGWVLQFDFAFENTGSRALSMNPGNYALLDDEGRRLEARFPENAGKIENFELWPRSSLRFSLMFDFPPGYELTKTGSLRLLWNYRVGNREHRRMTKFLRRIVEIRYREVPTYWYDPFYPHWHWGFYRRGGCGVRFGW